MIPQCWMCKSTTLTLIERWRGQSIKFLMQDGKIVDHFQGEDEEPYRVDAVCGCGHKWKLRGVIQISDVDSYNEYEYQDNNKPISGTTST